MYWAEAEYLTVCIECTASHERQEAFRGKGSSEVCCKHLKFHSSKSLLFFRNLSSYNLKHFCFTFSQLYLLEKPRHSCDDSSLSCIKPSSQIKYSLFIPTCSFSPISILCIFPHLYSSIPAKWHNGTKLICN